MPQPRNTLTIGISALATDASAIQLPDPRPGWEILVVIQGTGDRFRTDREDVRILRVGCMGVARSRNHVLQAARSDYVLFADADSRVIAEGASKATRYLDAHPNVDILLGRAVDESGHLRKRYSRRGSRLTRWNSARAGTIELLVRRQSQIDAGIWFDADFGAGAFNPVGDEYIFISDLIRCGKRGRSVPIDFACHPAESSGTNPNIATLAARAPVFARVFGRSAPLARVLFLIKRPRGAKNLGELVDFVVDLDDRARSRPNTASPCGPCDDK